MQFWLFSWVSTFSSLAPDNSSKLVASDAKFRKKRHTKHHAALTTQDDDDSSSSSTLFSCSGPKKSSAWTYYPNYTTIDCNTSNTYLGPYGQDGYISTTLNTTSTHNGIIVSFNLALLDSWDGENFKVSADDTVVYAILYTDNETLSNTCGNDWSDNYVQVKFGFNHSNSSVTLKFYSTLDQSSDDEAWGICDLAITTSETYVNTNGEELEIEASGDISELTFSCTDPEQDDAWTYNPVYSTFYCNNNYYLGPYGSTDSISAVLSVSETHKNIIMSFKLALIDSWDAETLTITADGATVYTLTHSSSEGSTNTCQNGWKDMYLDVQFGFSHNGKYLTLEFTSSLDQGANDEAWGICNLSIVATTGNIDSAGDYIGTGTGDSAPGSFFSCSSPALDEGWSYSPYYTTITCGDNTYVGGYGTDGQISAVLDISDDHKGVIVSFKLALLDSWEGEEFIVTADGEEVYSYTNDYNTDSSENTCGAAYNDNFQDVTFGFNHTNSTLTLVFTSNLDQSASDESWGICDLEIEISDDHVDADGNTL